MVRGRSSTRITFTCTGRWQWYSINPATGALTAIAGSPSAAGADPVSVAVDPSGKFAYVANGGEASVSEYSINPTTGALSAVAGSQFATGREPISVAVTRTMSSVRAVYIVNEGSKTVSVINPLTKTIVATVTVGPNPVVATVGVEFIPVHVSISPDGAHAYVTNAGSNSVSVIDISTNSVIATLPVGVHPVNAAIF